MKIKDHHDTNLNIFTFKMFDKKMPSSSLYTRLKLSKTTSHNKLFGYDCVTLYMSRLEVDIFLKKVHFGRKIEFKKEK